MKTVFIIAAIAILIPLSNSVRAQTINWSALKEGNKHIFNANVGLEYGIIFGVGYAYKIKKSPLPTLVNFEYAIPSGKNLTDDYKMKFGGQMRLVEYKNFYLSTKFQGIFRGYKNDLVSMINLGTDVSITLGYYRNRWFLASELGFDKAFGTHLKHTESYKSNYSQVIDGWYGPSTGGNFHYGLQTGLRFGKHEIYSKFGKIISQDFESTPLIPIFFQLGYNLKLGDI